MFLTLFVPLDAGSGPGDPDAGPADKAASHWLKRLRECQKGVFSIRADFVQERFHKLRPSPEKMVGVAEVRRGGRVRLKYLKPTGKTITSDGEVLWAYDQEERTAYKSDAKKSLINRIFGFILDDGGDAFSSRLLGGETQTGKGPVAIELSGRVEDPAVKKVVLTLDEPCPLITRVLVVDHTGAVTRITLSNIETNVKLGKRRFIFRPPRGTSVVKP